MQPLPEHDLLNGCSFVERALNDRLSLERASCNDFASTTRADLPVARSTSDKTCSNGKNNKFQNVFAYSRASATVLAACVSALGLAWCADVGEAL